MVLLKLVIFTVIIAITTAKVVHITNCDDVSADMCNVSEVRIEPCSGKSRCIFKKGINASLSFDFTPNFSASKLKTMVYGKTGDIYVEFPDMSDNDGCKFTTCPTETGKSQVLDFTLNIGKKLPSGIFDFKWKVWNEADEAQVCCFITTVQLRK